MELPTLVSKRSQHFLLHEADWQQYMQLRRSLGKCFWIANQASIREIEKIDLRIHPPPDLAIEVEVSRRLLDRKSAVFPGLALRV